MPNKTTGKKTGSATAPWTADVVIDMFADVGLPVCDDADIIREACNKRRSYYLSLTRKTSPLDQEQGKRGLKNLDAMQNNRPALLQIVYERFRDLADVALASLFSSGKKILTPALYNSLHENLARSQCRTDDGVATRHLEGQWTGHARYKPQPKLGHRLGATHQTGQVFRQGSDPRAASRCHYGL